MPCMVLRNDFPLSIRKVLVFRRGKPIKKSKERAVGHEWYDAVRFIAHELQTADPHQDYDQAYAQQTHGEAVAG